MRRGQVNDWWLSYPQNNGPFFFRERCGKLKGSASEPLRREWMEIGRVLWEGMSGLALCRVMRRSRPEFIDDDFGIDQISTGESLIS